MRAFEASEHTRSKWRDVQEDGPAVGRVRVTYDETLSDEAIAQRRRARETHAECLREVTDAQRLSTEHEQGPQLPERQVDVLPGVR